MRAAPKLRLATRADAPGIAALSRDRIKQGLGWRWTALGIKDLWLAPVAPS